MPGPVKSVSAFVLTGAVIVVTLCLLPLKAHRAKATSRSPQLGRVGSEKPLTAMPTGILEPLGTRIGKDSIETVLARFGAATVKREEDAHKPWTVCYRTNDDVPFFIEFDFGFLELHKLLTGIRLTKGKQVSTADTCAVIRLEGPIQVGGIRLGITRAALEQRLGKPTGEAGNRIEYVYLGTRRMTEEEIQRLQGTWQDVREDPFFDVMVYLEASFEESALLQIAVHWTETY